jgi:hypothetical protein
VNQVIGAARVVAEFSYLRRSLPGPPRRLRPRTATTRDDERTGNVSSTA